MLFKIQQEKDVLLMSALMQNSIFKKSWMFLEKGVLRCMITRFCWEQEPFVSKRGKKIFFRTNSALIFENVERVKSRNFCENFQNLLAIEVKDNLWKLTFSNSDVEIHCQNLKCFLKDLSCVWATLKVPNNEV